ncbi:MAG TPA: hypothetical protein VFY90_12120 [Tepidiformaceae bacterium]|nr:hypothetical protein [Tepidiformaceae bacterium]
MIKTLFGFSAAALVAAAIALPAMRARVHEEQPLARQAGSTVDGNDGDVNPGGEAMVFSFVSTVSKASPVLK